MKNKFLVIGIDSATFDIINPMIQQGLLPNLSALVKYGSAGPLQSTVPPVTPPAWTSFMTGKNPGKHGVFDFYVPPSYGYSRPVWNSHYVKAKTIWRILSDHGFKQGVINLPMTHPPEKINGFVIPGMQYSFEGDAGFSFPPELMQEIKNKVGDYRVLYGDLESLYTDQLDRLLAEWREIFEVRRQTILHLIEQKEWDVFMAVFYSIDVMQHHFWKFYDAAHPLHDPQLSARYGNVIPEFYEKIDSAIGEMLQRIGEDTAVLVVSDHGAGPEEESFFLNNWLSQEGLLGFRQPISPLWRFRFPHLFYKVLRRWKFPGIAWTVPLNKLRTLGQAIDPREGLNIPYFIDWKKTRAYAGNHTEQGIYINLKGREPMGIVERGAAYEALRDTIIQKLKNLKNDRTGEPVEMRIYKKEEVYSGPNIGDAPDLFVEMREGRCLMQKEIYHKKLFGSARKSSGTHRKEGIFILKGREVKSGYSVAGISIVDMAPTILYALGLPIPEDMDGKVIVDVFEDKFAKSNPVTYCASPEITGAKEEGVMSHEESEKAKESLRSLGYFG